MRPKRWAKLSQVQREEKDPSTWIEEICEGPGTGKAWHVWGAEAGSMEHQGQWVTGREVSPGALGLELSSCSLSQRKDLCKERQMRFSFSHYLGFMKE